MKPVAYTTNHLIKESNANHHHTLFAGQGVSWMVETGVICVASMVKHSSVVCLQIQGLLFKKAVSIGSVLRMDARAVLSGRTSITVHVLATDALTGEFIVDGFVTYVTVDEEGKSVPHGITIEPETKDEIRWNNEAKKLMENKI